MWSLIGEAEDRGCTEALSVRAKLRMVSAACATMLSRRSFDENMLNNQFPPRGVKQDLPAAFEAYTVSPSR
jgi:hypothetical protein